MLVPVAKVTRLRQFAKDGRHTFGSTPWLRAPAVSRQTLLAPRRALLCRKLCQLNSSWASFMLVAALQRFRQIVERPPAGSFKMIQLLVSNPVVFVGKRHHVLGALRSRPERK